MDQKELKKIVATLSRLTGGLASLVVVVLLGFVFVLTRTGETSPQPNQSVEDNVRGDDGEERNLVDLDLGEVVNNVHVETGLIAGEGYQLVVSNCTKCHSAKLVTQNRQTREGWVQVIRWMQETQGLWDMGPDEKTIVDYLAKHYAPEPTGRRKPLATEWYMLD